MEPAATDSPIAGRAIADFTSISVIGTSPADRSPALFPIGVVDRLVIAGKRLSGYDDALQPFDRRHSVPTGHDRTEGITVRRNNGSPFIPKTSNTSSSAFPNGKLRAK